MSRTPEQSMKALAAAAIAAGWWPRAKQPAELDNPGPYMVWWIPQVPGKRFTKRVRSVREGALLLEALADYDLFQLEQNIKPDFSNAGGLIEYVDGEWIDWYSEDGLDDDPVARVRELDDELPPLPEAP